MNILRAILIGLASFVYVVVISGFVYLLTINTTVMDRSVVKTWLKESQIYDGQLISALVQTPPTDSQQGSAQSATSKISASPEAVKAAFAAAFTPEFTQTQLEGVVDNAYNWIDGTSPEFKFSVPIDQKRDVIIAQLAKSIEPQVAALPICRSTQLAQQSVCRPANISPEQLATELTTQSIDESGAFAAPLTEKSFTKSASASGQPSGTSTLANLPTIHKGINTLLLALPIIAFVSIAIILTVTIRGQRLTAAARLARRIFFGMLFLLVRALVVVWLAKDNDFGLANLLTTPAAALFIPLIKTIAVGILSKLALISGIVGGIAALFWIGLGIWKRQVSLTPPPAPQVVTSPPTSPQATTTPLQPPSTSPTLVQSPQPQPASQLQPPVNRDETTLQ
jgi:hypothetical protein